MNNLNRFYFYIHFSQKISWKYAKVLRLSLLKWPPSFIVPGNGQFIYFFFRSKLFTWIISIITVKKYYYCLPSSSSSSSSSSSWDLLLRHSEMQDNEDQVMEKYFQLLTAKNEKIRRFKWMIKIEFIAYWHTLTYKGNNWTEGELSCKNLPHFNVIADFFKNNLN